MSELEGVHLVAASASISSASGLAELTPLMDPVPAIVGNTFVFQEEAEILAAYAGRAQITQAQIAAPSFLEVGNVELPQVEPTTGAPPTDPNLSVFVDGPPRTRGGEPVRFKAATADAGAATAYGFAWLGFGPRRPLPYLPSYWLRMTESSGILDAMAGATGTPPESNPAASGEKQPTKPEMMQELKLAGQGIATAPEQGPQAPPPGSLAALEAMQAMQNLAMAKAGEGS